MKTRIIAGLFAASLLASCAGNKQESVSDSSDVVVNQEVADVNLAGQWSIESIVVSDSVTVRPSEQGAGESQYIVFTDSAFSVQTNCNSISGDYTLKGDSIVFGGGIMTQMACENMAVEDALREMLPAIATVKVENDSVVRLQGGASQYILLQKVAEEK